MDYADLISSKVARLPVDRQAEVLRYGYGVRSRNETFSPNRWLKPMPGI
jgi:hypothetical protein